MGFFDSLFGETKKSFKIVDIDNLGSRDGHVFCWKKYRHRPQRHRLDLSDVVDGRKVKFWLWFYGADDEDGDRFVPIYYGENLPRRRINQKRIRKKVVWRRIRVTRKHKRRSHH